MMNPGSQRPGSLLIRIFSVYLRSICESFRRWNDRELEVVWQFSMGSVVCIVLAVIAIFNAIVGKAIASSLLAAAGFVGISAATGAYVVYAVHKAAIEDNDDAGSLD